MLKNLSVSQAQTYGFEAGGFDKGCPYRWHLERQLKAWQKPAAWFQQGTAVHEAMELWELSGRAMTLEEVQDAFRTAYVREVNVTLEDAPNMQVWHRSGPYDGEADIERRYGIGLEQVGKLLDYYVGKGLGDVVWVTPDGVPAIELRFDLELEGLPVPVIGFIDKVRDLGKTDVLQLLGPDDLKSGNEPGGPFQLGTYKVGIEEAYEGTQVTEGRYLMAGKKGKKSYATNPYDLTGWTKPVVTEIYQEVYDGIINERFDPMPEESKCRFCGVQDSCKYKA